jgi:hypothetical protein
VRGRGPPAHPPAPRLDLGEIEDDDGCYRISVEVYRRDGSARIAFSHRVGENDCPEAVATTPEDV